ncbi:MAG: (3R)-hydroxyacyl-ACP dehydratase subunit HadB, partial [uncultured Arthrobacter sp.]
EHPSSRTDRRAGNRVRDDSGDPPGPGALRRGLRGLQSHPLEFRLRPGRRAARGDRPRHVHHGRRRAAGHRLDRRSGLRHRLPDALHQARRGRRHHGAARGPGCRPRGPGNHRGAGSRGGNGADRSHGDLRGPEGPREGPGRGAPVM